MGRYFSYITVIVTPDLPIDLKSYGMSSFLLTSIVIDRESLRYTFAKIKEPVIYRYIQRADPYTDKQLLDEWGKKGWILCTLVVMDGQYYYYFSQPLAE